MTVTSELLKKISEPYHDETIQAYTGVSTDTRTIKAGMLFVPLVGERFDGHEYILQAIEKGAAATLWDKNKPIPELATEKISFFFVEDTLEALQELATVYLNTIAPKVIAVTGSNGKTTTKDLLYSVLSPVFKTFKTQGNFNNHIGLPLTVLAMPEDCEVLILEMGMSGFGEIKRLSEIATPDVAIVTNIGESHLEQLGSREGIAKAKMEIIAGLKENGLIILDGDEPLLASYKGKDVQRVGFGAANHIQIKDIVSTVSGYQFSLSTKQEIFTVPLLGEHNVKNAAYALAVAFYLGLDMSDAKKGLEKTRLSAMRLEQLKGSCGELILNDAYNASPTSMKAAVQALKSIPGFEKRIAVLGDMYELGEEEEAMHRSVAEVIASPVTHLYTVGEKGFWIADEAIKQGDFLGEIRSFSEKDELLPVLKAQVDVNTVVLFKASRGMSLETCIHSLTRKEGE
ncbi:UDP-N-acetylmuramoyl-tripeptide--D-alanyl-D-alanine ligase [Halalkalibacterium ligniniphilum]|uniref:UDP-N-acetylmuramoyl-tripeptide--D-alanyl-D- alanine ligase n=1 Tax=Halalkalibacterium ligniniphilum TaxID=1134413 RepID=UPI00034B707E|nr:UDP-N-acetylmuramoyl-tripeptide--D-alanyl-D-alanine ligase [Halalkalibacterium ligniniphilum]